MAKTKPTKLPKSNHVYFGWEGGRDLERVQLEMSRFSKLWDNKLPNVRVLEVPEAVKRKLLRYTPTTQPTWEQQNEFDYLPLPQSSTQPELKRDRINAFATVVGNLQPILAKVPTFLERAVMSADPQEQDVLLSEFDRNLNTPPLRPALDEMVAMDVEADLAELRKPIS